MCGIAGYFDSNNRRSAAEMQSVVRAMADTLAHRGPDDSGIWVDPDSGIALGHRRLSIIDLSPAGHQPMVSGSGRFTIVFNGEVYNHLEILAELKSKFDNGISLRGHSDTEVILAAFDHWGVEQTLPRLSGMFAIAVWDRVERALWLARDRFGKKPLYYTQIGSTTMFASELKALRAHPEFHPDLDANSVASYLRYNCIPAPQSVYCCVRKLPAGSWLRQTAGISQPEPHPYWSLTEIVRSSKAMLFNGTEEEAAEELDRRLRAAVRSRMVASDVPVGLFLSGGIDSSTVTALAQAQSSIPVRTFCIGMAASKYDESGYAKSVARHLGCDHTEWILDPKQAMDVVAKLPTMFDEPFADASSIPTYLVSYLARQHVTVALSGDGGDEVFGGYNRHILAAKLWPAIASIPPAARLPFARLFGAVTPDRWESIMNRVVPSPYRLANLGDKLHKIQRVTGARDSEDLYRKLISNWEDPSAVLSRNFSVADSSGVLPAWSKDLTPTESMMIADALGYMQDDILVKVDRASMAVSLEVRNPFLDPSVFEFAWSLPLEYKVRDGVGKRIVRRVLDRYVPPDLTNRPKMGFAIPVADWLRGPLRDWAESLLNPATGMSDGILQEIEVRRVWAEFLRGRSDYTDKVWCLLMLRGWLATQASG